jgi:PPM family protein phosphatase
MDRITIAAKTHPGMKRRENQDHFGFFTPEDDGHTTRKGILMAVADGMGGHAGGAEASRMAIETLMSEYYQAETEDIPLALNAAFQKANRAIFEKSRSENSLRGMGATLSAAVIQNDRLFWAHVGDSRGYVIHKKKTRQFTTDHSYVAELVRAGAITEDEALSHPRRNVITKAVGTHPSLDVDLSPGYQKLKEGRYVLLCSDGLFKVISDREIAQIIHDLGSPGAVCDELISLANRRGGPDNVTVALARKNKNEGRRGFFRFLKAETS